MITGDIEGILAGIRDIGQQYVNLVGGLGEDIGEEARSILHETIVAELRKAPQANLLALEDLMGIARTALVEAANELPIERTIRRPFAEAPSDLPGQTPAIECAVMFRCGLTIQGVLSETPDGQLKMLTPNPPPPGRPGARMLAEEPIPMAEQFFSYEEIAMVAVRREVSVETSRIVRG